MARGLTQLNVSTAERIAAILAAGAVVAMNVGTLSFGWQAIDDFDLVLHQASVTSPGQAGLLDLVFTPGMGHWMPLTNASLAFDFARCGADAGCFRQTTLALIALTAAALTFALARFGTLFARGDRASISPWAACAAVVFAYAHPVTAEPIAWIASRKDVLSVAFVAIGLAACAHQAEALKHARPRALMLCAAPFVAAMLSKATTLFVPLFFIGLLTAWGLRWRTIALSAAPIAAVGAGSALLAARSQATMTEWSAYGGLGGRLDAAGAALFGHGLRLTGSRADVPISFVDLYPAPTGSWALAGALSALFFLAGGVFALHALHRSRSTGRDTVPMHTIALALALTTLLPMSGWLGRVTILIADRYLYLPWIVAGSATIALLLTRSAELLRPLTGRSTPAIASVALVALAMTQLPARGSALASWRDAEAFSARLMAAYPATDPIALNEGLYYVGCMFDGLGVGIFALNRAPAEAFPMTSEERRGRISEARDRWATCLEAEPSRPSDMARKGRAKLRSLVSRAERELAAQPTPPPSESEVQ